MRKQVLLGLGIVMFGLFGCGRKPDQMVTLNGQSYLIPGAHEPVIDRERKPPQYVKITSAYFTTAGNFTNGLDLNLDFGGIFEEFHFQNDIPHIFGAASENMAEYLKQVAILQIDNTKIYCGLSEHDSINRCGFRMQEGNVSWSVTFYKKDIQSAPKIREEAIKLLKSYREAANAKSK